METERNPYRPGVGLPPPYLAGRQDEQARFKRTLTGAPEIPGNIRMSGLRGVGKTVLLKRFQEIADEEGWATVNLEIQPRLNTEATLLNSLAVQFEGLSQRLSLAAKVRAKASAVTEGMRRIVKVTYQGFEWSLAGDLAPQTQELGNLLIQAVQDCTNHNKRGLVLLLDEAQVLTDEKSSTGSHTLSTLVAAVSALQKESVPICLVVCGLPTLAVNLLNARTYSERMFQGVEVTSLAVEFAREAFTEPLKASAIHADSGLVDRVMREVEGYPYFIQLWGAELWDATVEAGLTQISVTTLDVVEPRIYSRLDSDFYEPRIASLTPAEQDLLLASGRCQYPPLTVSELNQESPKSPGNINVLLGRLVAANVIYRLRKGQYHYTAPGFRDFLQRRDQAH